MTLTIHQGKSNTTIRQCHARRMSIAWAALVPVWLAMFMCMFFVPHGSSPPVWYFFGLPTLMGLGMSAHQTFEFWCET